MYCSHPLTPINKTFRLGAPYSCSSILCLSYNVSNFCVTQTLMKIIYTSYRIKCFSWFFRLLLETVREKSINFKLKRTNRAIIFSNTNILSFLRIRTIVYIIFILISISVMDSTRLTYLKFLAYWIKEWWINFTLYSSLETSFSLKKWLINRLLLSYFKLFNILLIFEIIVQFCWYFTSVLSILKLN